VFFHAIFSLLPGLGNNNNENNKHNHNGYNYLVLCIPVSEANIYQSVLHQMPVG